MLTAATYWFGVQTFRLFPPSGKFLRPSFPSPSAPARTARAPENTCLHAVSSPATQQTSVSQATTHRHRSFMRRCSARANRICQHGLGKRYQKKTNISRVKSNHTKPQQVPKRLLFGHFVVIGVPELRRKMLQLLRTASFQLSRQFGFSL